MAASACCCGAAAATAAVPAVAATALEGSGDAGPAAACMVAAAAPPLPATWLLLGLAVAARRTAAAAARAARLRSACRASWRLQERISPSNESSGWKRPHCSREAAGQERKSVERHGRQSWLTLQDTLLPVQDAACLLLSGGNWHLPAGRTFGAGLPRPPRLKHYAVGIFCISAKTSGARGARSAKLPQQMAKNPGCVQALQAVGVAQCAGKHGSADGPKAQRQRMWRRRYGHLERDSPRHARHVLCRTAGTINSTAADPAYLVEAALGVLERCAAHLATGVPRRPAGGALAGGAPSGGRLLLLRGCSQATAVLRRGVRTLHQVRGGWRRCRGPRGAEGRWRARTLCCGDRESCGRELGVSRRSVISELCAAQSL